MESMLERRVMENAIDDSGRGQRNRRNNHDQHEGAFNDIPENVLQVEGDQNARPSQGNQTGVLQLVEPLTGELRNVVEKQKLRNGIFGFKKFDPPAFEGSADPLDADKWLMKIEKIFWVMNFDDDEKVLCASFMLQGGADDWWRMEELRHKANPEPYTWDKFKTAFYDRYFPKYVRYQKVDEFINLKQGDMSVVEYENKFSELFKFALELFATEEYQAWRFQQGLRPEIKLVLAPFELKTITEVVSKAKLVEWGLDEVQKENDCHRRKRYRPTGLQVGEDGPLKKLETKGRNHCNTGACFACGQKGHLAADCPHKKS